MVVEIGVAEEGGGDEGGIWAVVEESEVFVGGEGGAEKYPVFEIVAEGECTSQERDQWDPAAGVRRIGGRRVFTNG